MIFDERRNVIQSDEALFKNTMKSSPRSLIIEQIGFRRRKKSFMLKNETN